MKILDYFLYVIYRFNHYTANKYDGNAKWCAVLVAGAYLTMLGTILTYVCMLSSGNDQIVIFKDRSPDIALVACIFLWLLLSLRYYKIKKDFIPNMDKKYNSLTPVKQIMIRRIVGFIVVMSPVVLFLITRYVAKLG